MCLNPFCAIRHRPPAGNKLTGVKSQIIQAPPAGAQPTGAIGGRPTLTCQVWEPKCPNLGENKRPHSVCGKYIFGPHNVEVTSAYIHVCNFLHKVLLSAVGIPPIIMEKCKKVKLLRLSLQNLCHQMCANGKSPHTLHSMCVLLSVCVRTVAFFKAKETSSWKRRPLVTSHIVLH